MKIVQIIPFLGLGGAETMCENLTYELVNQGHNVIVLSMYTKKTPITERMEKANIDIRYLDKKNGMDLSLYKKIHKILRDEKPDAVHSHLYAIKYIAPIAGFAGVKRVVHTVHSIAQKEAGGFSRKLNKFFFKAFGVVPVALSQLIKETIIETYKMPAEKVPFIYNGVDLSKCIPKSSYAVGEEIKIIHVGSFYEPKNHIGLARAFHRVYEMHPECRLYLIGEGAERENVEKYVKDNGMENKVIFLGSQSNVFSFLKDMDIFTLPSNYEGIPMSLIEAMGTALPVVATAVGGIPDMVENEQSALLTEVDEKQIADALIRLVESLELRERLGRNAYACSEKFSSVRMAEKYLEIYRG